MGGERPETPFDERDDRRQVLARREVGHIRRQLELWPRLTAQNVAVKKRAPRRLARKTGSGGGVANAEFSGSITIPSTGTGSITSSEISATTVHGAIDEVNERIPNVYNRSGTLLNP